MALDPSIYGTLRPQEYASPLDSVSKAYTLKHLALQSAAQDRANQTQEAIQSAYKNNMNPDGTLNRAGALSQLVKENAAGAIQLQEHFNKSDKESAEAQTARAKALHDTVSAGLPFLHQALKMPDELAAQAWPQHVQQMQEAGLSTKNLPQAWNRAAVQANFDRGSEYKEALENKLMSGNIAKQPLEREKLGLENAKLRGEIGGEKQQFANLPVENQEQIKKLADKNATKAGISTQIDATVKMLKDPQINSDQKLMQARQMIKVLNSVEGQDAVGAEEAKRLAGLLEYHVWPNMTNPGPMFGRAPIEDFTTQAELSSRGLKDAMQTNQGIIGQLKTGKPLQVDVPQVGEIVAKKQAGEGGLVKPAFAGTPKITPQDAQALQWVKDPKNASSPEAFQIRAKLKAKGVL
jgi:hypothetical protein